MLEQVSVSTRVGSEWLGKARAFRSEVKTVDVAMDAALAIVTMPLRARLKRHPKLRAEMLPVVAHQYERLIPAEFELGAITASRHKTTFAIEELRMVVSWLQDDRWDDPEAREQGLSLCRFTLAVKDGKLLQRWRPIANVSLHAIGRWFERSRERDHATLLRDLAVLVEADEASERVDTGDGYWLGAVVTAKDGKGRVRLRNVRTWLSTDG